jgi:hypothetical protein
MCVLYLNPEFVDFEKLEKVGDFFMPYFKVEFFIEAGEKYRYLSVAVATK